MVYQLLLDNLTWDSRQKYLKLYLVYFTVNQPIEYNLFKVAIIRRIQFAENKITYMYLYVCRCRFGLYKLGKLYTLSIRRKPVQLFSYEAFSCGTRDRQKM